MRDTTARLRMVGIMDLAWIGKTLMGPELDQASHAAACAQAGAAKLAAAL